ncbi:potassium/sodium hyperpolarization-activated cyclic nucleotide-gated channel 1-like [Tribolium madens]|uniref:potassium/sodium hyperpolarization-activated cyclic nucleotide-gated channel 1-like n=1 Tax=Tribolium madens TaxID=41895 RepID=UPI001CF7226A|nr:potassium/sodium hyperpolarization-activated cyclic nucleotide-gated channel 1-like [Tribolium madens]
MKKIKLPTPIRKIPHHKCGLPIQGESLAYRIHSGLFVGLRRRIWKWKTINNSILESKTIFKSTAQMYIEEQRHFYRHRWKIHPYSQARLVWEMFMIPVFLSLFVVIPAVISFSKVEGSTLILFYVKFGLDIISFVDIVLNFFTGYYDEKQQKIVLGSKEIAKHYICRYFIFDIVSSFPFHMILHWHKQDQDNMWELLNLLKVVRLPTLLNYLRKLGERVKFLSYSMKFMCFFLWVSVLLVWTTSFLFVVVKIIHARPILLRRVKDAPMLMTFFRVVRCTMLVGVSEQVNTNTLVMIIQIVGFVAGAILQIVILSKLMQLFQKRSSSTSKYKNLIEEIGEYMKYKELPTQLKDRILKYVEFKFQKHIFREEDVLSNLSSVLKQDILIHRCQKMVENVEFFKDLPTHVFLRIVTKLRSEIFLPNDVIVLAGYAGQAMYFIYMGTVAVYTGNGKEICHLEDGSHFGEIALVINEPRVATVIAVKECELFKLSRRDFQEAIEPFPELNKKIRQLAMSRLESTLQILSENNEEIRIQHTSMMETEEDEVIDTVSI